MRTLGRTTLVLLALAGIVWLAACSDDDPTTPGGTPDTTPPEVVGTDPSGGAAAVSLDDSVFVVFSEAMDTATAAGQVAMTPASNHGFTWYDDRTLAIGHDPWSEGTQVTVTLGTGLTDAAGNALAAAHAFSFWTVTTSGLLLLDTTPENGATGVNRDDPIILTFSADINTGTVDGNVTIADDATKATYGYDVQNLGDGVILLDPDVTLPASSTITVTVGTGVQSWSGPQSLADPVSFSYETGEEVDTTPPTITGFEPNNGALSVSPNQGFLRLTFSEPVNPDSIEPRRTNLAFYILMERMTSEPVFSEGGTVMTVALPAPLPAGMPMVIVFDGIADLAGNVQSTPVTYEIKVAGNADYVPVQDGARYMVQEEWQEGTLDPETMTDEGFDSWAMQLETQGDGTYRLVNYADPEFASPLGWEAFRRTGSALQWLGFEEVPAPPPSKEMFDDPLTILPLPPATGTWESSTTVTIEGEGDYRANLAGTVIGRSDYEIQESGGEVFIKDAWKVVRVLDVEILDGVDWVPAMSQVDTVWYAPTLGDVRTHRYEETPSENTWYESVTWHFPWDPSVGKAQPAFWHR